MKVSNFMEQPVHDAFQTKINVLTKLRHKFLGVGGRDSLPLSLPNFWREELTLNLCAYLLSGLGFCLHHLTETALR